MGARKLNNKYNILATNIRRLRNERKMSQADVCREMALIGVTMYSADIYDVEYNLRTIKDYEVFAFAKVLNVTLDELYKGTEKEFGL